jgi:hypothetical protein
LPYFSKNFYEELVPRHLVKLSLIEADLRQFC